MALYMSRLPLLPLIAAMVRSPSSYFSMVPSKRKLITISVQVAFGDMVESPVDTPFQQGKIRFYCIGRNITPCKFLPVMSNSLMAAGTVLRPSAVGRKPFIGHYPGNL